MSDAPDLDRLHRANPLLEPLGRFLPTHAEWIERLENCPIEGFDVQNATLEDRLAVLTDTKNVFEPTKIALACVMDVDDMVRASLRQRNPYIRQARDRRLQMLHVAPKELKALKWNKTPIECKMIDGGTGLGKSHPVMRYVDLLPRKWVHEKNDALGDLKCTQLVTLVVSLKGTYRSGLLRAIVEAVDETLGTDHLSDCRSSDLSTLAVEVCKVLVAHYCGLLVFDNINVGNFTFSPHRQEMLYLLMALADTGVPLVMIGTPLALADLLDLAQNLRRLTMRETVHMMPFNRDDEDWRTGMVPAIWRHDVMPQRTRLDDTIRAFVDHNTGGIPHYVALIRESSQRAALRKGSEILTLEGMETWLQGSESMKTGRNLIAGFRDKDPEMLSSLVDLPWQQYGLMWGKLDIKEIEAQEASLATGKTPRRSPSKAADRQRLSLQLRAARKYQAEQAAADRRVAANAKVREGASSSLKFGL